MCDAVQRTGYGRREKLEQSGEEKVWVEENYRSECSETLLMGRVSVQWAGTAGL